MRGLLIDEMFPTTAAELLRDRGHDVLHVGEIGLRATADDLVTDPARAEDRGVVTENIRDYATDRDVVLVFVLKRNLPSGGALGPALAALLDRWLTENPDPYIGAHWPSG